MFIKLSTNLKIDTYPYRMQTKIHDADYFLTNPILKNKIRKKKVKNN